MRFTNVSLVVGNNVVPVTGAITGGTADTLARYVSGFNTTEFHWSGHVEISGTQGVAESSSIVHGTVSIHTGAWSIGRRWPLQDVTGCSAAGVMDTQKRWYPGIGTIFGSFQGYTLSSGPAFTTVSDEVVLDSETLTIKINQVTGTDGISGTAFLRTIRQTGAFVKGGAIPTSMSFVYNQNYTYDKTSEPGSFSAVLDETDAPTAPRVTGMAVTFDTGQTITSIDAYLNYVEISVPAVIGGPIPIRGSYRVDHP